MFDLIKLKPRALGAALAAALLATAPAGMVQAAPSSDSCTSDVFHQFDFFTGSFSLFNEAGAFDSDESVVPELNHCIIHEYLYGANQRSAQSVSFYDPIEKRWEQYAFGLGLVFRLKGGVKDGSMQMEGTISHLTTGQTRPMKASWTPLTDDTVREELYELDPASGKYRVLFSGTLKRK